MQVTANTSPQRSGSPCRLPAEWRRVQGHYPEIWSALQDWPYLPVRPPSSSLIITSHASRVPPDRESDSKQARHSWEKETAFGGATYGLRTFFPEERKINSLVHFSANLIFPAEHPSIISSNKAKSYKIIKLFSRQAMKRQRGVLQTQRYTHAQTHTALSNRKCFDITLHESTQEHTETKQHSYSDISGTGLGDVLHWIKYVMKYSHRYLMLLPLASMHCQKELLSWYTA